MCYLSLRRLTSIDNVDNRKETSAARLETNLRRIFQERGADFFEQRDGSTAEKNSQSPTDDATGEEKESGYPASAAKPMTTEELYTMRSEIIPQLLYVSVDRNI